MLGVCEGDTEILESMLMCFKDDGKDYSTLGRPLIVSVMDVSLRTTLSVSLSVAAQLDL